MNANGEATTRIQQYKNSGFLRDINTEVGFIIDNQDNLEFRGAQGKAITPGEYYDRALQQVAIDLGVPVDILKGVSAGAVTGSETNLVEYYADLKSKQVEHLEPIINQFFMCFGLNPPEKYMWHDIYEETPKAKVEQAKMLVETLQKLEQYNFIDHEKAVTVLARNSDVLGMSDDEVMKFSKLEKYESPVNAFTFGQSKDDESAFPKKTQKAESKYAKEMEDAFKESQNNFIRLLQAFERT